MNKQIYYRLIALWVLCEAMLGGIIHGLKIPVSGLFVGSGAVVCICLIAWYVPHKGAIIKATIIVAIFKMMLSPQAPPPAYIAVFFQGLVGELLFLRNRKFYQLSCILLAILSLLESGLQRILVLTVVYGNDLWVVVNNFINGLTKQKTATDYSLLIGSGYVLLHLITGVLVGWWAALLPGRIESWKKDDKYKIDISNVQASVLPAVTRKRKRLKNGLFIIWIILVALYIQSYFTIGKPLLPSHIALKIFIRSVIIVLSWIFIIGPLLKQLLHNWLQKEKTRSQQEIKEVLELLPATQQLVAQCWKNSSHLKGRKRLAFCSKTILVSTFSPPSLTRGVGAKVYILTAPIQSGKTTSLINWTANRNDVYGILTPVVNNKRVFMNAYTREQFPMEAAEGEEDIITVGRYIFSRAAFARAQQIIRNAISNSEWLIIDEIGPLELAGQGFHDELMEVMRSYKGKLLLVVRDKDGIIERVKDLLPNRVVTIISNLNHPDFY